MSEVRHFDDDVFQAYLEDELSEEDRAGVAAHAAACASCAAQLESWSALFQELGELPVLAPSNRLRARVLAESGVGSRSPGGLWERVRDVVANVGQAGLRHLRPRAVEDLLDGVAGQEAYTRVRAHAGRCATCAGQLAQWERLYGALAKLERLEPAPGFADRVMERVDARVPVLHPAPDPAFSLSRLKAAARSLLPSSRVGWTLTAAFGSAPALAIVVGLTLVVLHPLLTVGGLFTFVEWHVADFVRLASAWATQWVGDGLLAVIDSVPAQILLDSPGLTLMGLVALWAAMSAAGWVLYRQVVAPILLTSRHAQASS